MAGRFAWRFVPREAKSGSQAVLGPAWERPLSGAYRSSEVATSVAQARPSEMEATTSDEPLRASPAT